MIIHEERNQNLEEEDILKPTLIDFKLKQNLQEGQVMTDLLEEYKDIFEDLGETYLVKHFINTTIAAPRRKDPSRVSPKQQKTKN